MGGAEDNSKTDGAPEPLRLRDLMAFWLFSAELEDEKISHTWIYLTLWDGVEVDHAMTDLSHGIQRWSRIRPYFTGKG